MVKELFHLLDFELFFLNNSLAIIKILDENAFFSKVKGIDQRNHVS